MEFVTGTIYSKISRGAGTVYGIFIEDKGPVTGYSRINGPVLFDRVESTVRKTQSGLFMNEFHLVERSPLHTNPKHLMLACYLSTLIGCFTEGGPGERKFTDSVIELLGRRTICKDDLRSTEMSWLEAVGVGRENRRTHFETIQEYTGKLLDIRERSMETLPETGDERWENSTVSI